MCEVKSFWFESKYQFCCCQYPSFLSSDNSAVTGLSDLPTYTYTQIRTSWFQVKAVLQITITAKTIQGFTILHASKFPITDKKTTSSNSLKGPFCQVQIYIYNWCSNLFPYTIATSNMILFGWPLVFLSFCWKLHLKITIFILWILNNHKNVFLNRFFLRSYTSEQ